MVDPQHQQSENPSTPRPPAHPDETPARKVDLFAVTVGIGIGIGIGVLLIVLDAVFGIRVGN